MSVAVSIACGHDAWYLFKTTGAAESLVISGQCGAGYYLLVVEKGGDPAGPWRFGFEWAYRPARRVHGWLAEHSLAKPRGKHGLSS